jgi:hypothetical protein
MELSTCSSCNFGAKSSIRRKIKQFSSNTLEKPQYGIPALLVGNAYKSVRCMRSFI